MKRYGRGCAGCTAKACRGGLLSYFAALALTSTLAGTASLPYSAYHFGHVQIYYVLSNLVAVPLAAFWVMPAGMIALLLMPFGLGLASRWCRWDGAPR